MLLQEKNIEIAISLYYRGNKWKEEVTLFRKKFRNSYIEKLSWKKFKIDLKEPCNLKVEKIYT